MLLSVGLALFTLALTTLFLRSKHIQLMTASMLRVANPTPGSDNPTSMNVFMLLLFIAGGLLPAVAPAAAGFAVSASGISIYTCRGFSGSV